MDGLSGSGSTGGARRGALGGVANPVDPYWAHDVFDLLLAQILEGVIELVAHLVAHDPGDADPAGLGQPPQPRSDIHSVAKDVVFLNDYVAEIDADPKPDALFVWHLELAVDHPALNLHSAANGVYNTRKLRQEAIAGVLHNPAAMLLDLRIDKLPQMRLEAFVRALLIRPHQPRIPRHIGSEDRGEPARLAHVVSSAANRRPKRKSSRCSGLR